ncbi:unnamed protein product [Bursaphelenchus okinawaensis]|uniref:7TM_GPCR_Srx domain-containing protein n=1 Tax=Bursaphelenchus okinawaensis TaxID=465554 RepID=A0A811KYY5_9BILA|nr:unnamed protein product [Bursaphelenchus okinawaensis]CAG9114539.1 unnamed protein product [Bursaphelenchus okinawaensis]
MFGQTCGLIITLTLIVVVFNFHGSTNKVVLLYGRLVIAIAIQDAVFCTYEIGVQHILCFSGNKMFVNAYGWEQFAPEWILPPAFFFHIFFICNTFTFLPAIYSYRYEYLKKLSWMSLFARLGISMTCSAIGSFAAALAARKSLIRGKEYYLKLLPKAWFDDHGQSVFIYAVDLDDNEAVFWVFSTIVVSFSSISTTVYYAIKSANVVRENIHEESPSSNSVQKQFNRGLMAQTIAIGFMSNVPALVLFSCIALGFDGTYLGTQFMFSMSYVSATGSCMTIYFMRGYRRWLGKKLFGLKDRYDDNTSKGTSVKITTTQNN